jgi:hypothetical protein
MLERFGSIREFFFAVNFTANGRMGADQEAFTAL